MVPTTEPKIPMDAPLDLCSCWCGQVMENLPLQVIYFTYDPCYRNIRLTKSLWGRFILVVVWAGDTTRLMPYLRTKPFCRNLGVVLHEMGL